MLEMDSKLLKELEDDKVRIDAKVKIGTEFLYLSREACMKAGPTIDETLELVTKTLVAHGKGECEMPAKIGVHPHKEAFHHAMPAFVPSVKACGCKWIECYPQNPAKYGLPQTSSLLTLNEIMTGFPMSVMDGTWMTAMRTPAVTVIAAGALHPGAESFGMFGCGVQGVAHVRFVVKALKKLKKIYIYDTRAQAMDDLITQVKGDVPVEIIKAKSPKEIAENCQVMSSATVIMREPLAAVKDEWISAGQTILPCDLNTFWDPKTQKRADKYIVDSAAGHKLFAEIGYFPDGMPEVYAQTGEVVAGIAKGRESDKELIVCSNIGMSVFDVAMARFIFNKALDMGVGTKLTL
ncbi:MAG: ornithine cyclodeaminase family protein [Oscillospiraceae bacterium]|nr:ornithine cyclodeaminase family protein [Oscillospiraceae bacterium]